MEKAVYVNRILVTTALCMIASAAQSKDGWDANGRPTVCGLSPRPALCQEWVANTKQPDMRQVSCCGEADAFITDDYEVDADGNLWAIVTEDYPARPGYEEMPILKGYRILIPPHKMNIPRLDGGNPSGHSVTFLNSSRMVYCYFGPTGT